MTRRAILTGAGLTLVAATAGCANSRGSSGNSKSGEGGRTTGTLERIAKVDRKAVLTVRGTTLTGQALTTASWRGRVVVLNYWGSWCPPCVKETPALRDAWRQLRSKNVQFLGMNAQESAATGLAYMNANNLDYPSLAWDGGKFLLQLRGKAPAPPVTLVLDQQGRLAARVLSEVTASTLIGLVDDVLAEGAA